MKKFIFIITACLLLFPDPSLMAQEEVDAGEVNVDDLGNVNDEFKENFFNALAEKGKENYDRAILLLEKCVELQPENAAVHFELGKNYLMSSAFAKAEQSIQKAITIKGEDEWLLDTLFEVYSKSGDVKKSLSTLQKLVAINANYEELLPLQYLKAGQPEEALKTIDKLNEMLGESSNRSYMKRQILTQLPQREEPQLDEKKLLENIASQPDDEESYIKLIYLYGKQSDVAAVIRTAALLEKNIPDSDKAHLALYRIYMEGNQVEKSVASMKRIFKSDELEEEVKVKVLVDFINLEPLQNAAGAYTVEEAISTFADELEDSMALTALGDFYLKKKEVLTAISFYEKGLENDPADFELIKKVALLSIDTKNYERVDEVTTAALEIYPAQAFLYLLNGIALNHLDRHKEAIEQLDNGLTYILDDVKVEQDLYQQLAIAHEKMGNTTKAEQMRSKAKAITRI